MTEEFESIVNKIWDKSLNDVMYWISTQQTGRWTQVLKQSADKVGRISNRFAIRNKLK